MAPAAHLINLKVLGSDGSGEAADLIEAIDWAIRYRKQFGIRVLNLSLGAAPTQSYKDDPICLAVERAVKAGLVVVASAGNYGQTRDGKLVFGSVTSPGISPYAITVGAYAHAGHARSVGRRGGAVELEGPDARGSHRQARPRRARLEDRLDGGEGLGRCRTRWPDRFMDGPGARDYVAMSGTSMSAAVVSGAVALLLDGKPKLTPLQVKLALQGSADFMPKAGLLRAGAGSLDLGDLDSADDAPT